MHQEFHLNSRWLMKQNRPFVSEKLLSFGIRNLVDSLGKEGRRKVSHVACHENLASVLVER